MRKIFCLLLGSLLSLVAMQGQTEGNRYEVTGFMPTYTEQMKQLLTYPLAWQNAGIEDFGVWREQARQKVYDLMQNLPPAPEAYDMQVMTEEQREGYVAQRIELNLSQFYRIPAYLLLPDGAKTSTAQNYPAVVLLHDHGAKFTIGKEKMIRPIGVSQEVMDDAEDWAKRNYDSQFFGDYLAQHGYVVLSIDAIYWGERGRKEGPVYDVQQALAHNFLSMGACWSAWINIDDVRSVDFLASLPMVDAKRIGCCGHSMGSYRSWMLSALTDKVAASANVCWMVTTDVQMSLANTGNKGGSGYSMLIPGLRCWMDYPHIASIACPKPTLFYNGRQDKLFPVEGVEAAYQTMREVWESQGASDRLTTQLWDGPHFFSRSMQEEVLHFFDRWLR